MSNDMSQYLGHQPGWEMPLDGLYECIDFKMYWDNPKTQFPFLIYYQDEIAGFVIIDKKGMHAGIDFNIAQFFIIRKFKQKVLEHMLPRNVLTSLAEYGK